jgi:hypothetical protein
MQPPMLPELEQPATTNELPMIDLRQLDTGTATGTGGMDSGVSRDIAQ